MGTNAKWTLRTNAVQRLHPARGRRRVRRALALRHRARARRPHLPELPAAGPDARADQSRRADRRQARAIPGRAGQHDRPERHGAPLRQRPRHRARAGRPAARARHRRDVARTRRSQAAKLYVIDLDRNAIVHGIGFRTTCACRRRTSTTWSSTTRAARPATRTSATPARRAPTASSSSTSTAASRGAGSADTQRARARTSGLRDRDRVAARIQPRRDRRDRALARRPHAVVDAAGRRTSCSRSTPTSSRTARRDAVIVARHVVPYDQRDFAWDGLDCDREGRVYFTDVTHGTLQRFIPAENRYETLLHGDHLGLARRGQARPRPDRLRDRQPGQPDAGLHRRRGPPRAALHAVPRGDRRRPRAVLGRHREKPARPAKYDVRSSPGRTPYAACASAAASADT